MPRDRIAGKSKAAIATYSILIMAGFYFSSCRTASHHGEQSRLKDYPRWYANNADGSISVDIPYAQGICRAMIEKSSQGVMVNGELRIWEPEPFCQEHRFSTCRPEMDEVVPELQQDEIFDHAIIVCPREGAGRPISPRWALCTMHCHSNPHGSHDACVKQQGQIQEEENQNNLLENRSLDCCSLLPELTDASCEPVHPSIRECVKSQQTFCTVNL